MAHFIITTMASRSRPFGYAALTNNTGTANRAVGAEALVADTTGSQNVAMGWHALHSNTATNSNMAIGASALSQSTGSNNTAGRSRHALPNTLSASAHPAAAGRHRCVN